MNILGLSFDYHDAAAALLIDKEIAFAAEEERYSRIKHDRSLPVKAIAAGLKYCGLTVRDLDAVVFYEKPMVKFGRIYKAASGPQGEAYLDETLSYWIKCGKFSVVDRIALALDIPLEKIHLVGHHQSHAASAFYCSAFDEATVVTLDGVGEYETASISLGKNNQLQQIDALDFPNSIGLFYSAMTAFLGFEVNEGEYKVMGMAGFGSPTFYEKIRPLIFANSSRLKKFFGATERIHLNEDYFDFNVPGSVPFKQALVDLLGKPRAPESHFCPLGENADEESRHYANIAASVQRVTEDVIIHYISAAIQKTSVKSVALAGGVALNSLANGRVMRELKLPLYVHPSPGDAGGALGAALYYRCAVVGLSRPSPLEIPFLGSNYSEEDVLKALSMAKMNNFEVLPSVSAVCQIVAKALSEGKVAGWFQGRFEWGPRALGARSILANPAAPNMQRIINEKIKFREPFRPFAPAILSECASEYFEVALSDEATDPEYFMLSVCRVREEKKSEIPAVTHVDGTARVQFVGKNHGTPFRALIEEFYQLTGVPLLLNTSFNRRGEPMVCSPQDALLTFSYSDLDLLAMGNIILWK